MRSAPLLVLAGCLVAPRAASIGPGVGIGMTTNFRARLTVDGKERDVVYWPRKTIFAAQMIAVGLRHDLAGPCDATADLSLGRMGGEARCHAGDRDAAAGLAAGAYWHPFHGAQAVARAEARLGNRSFRIIGSMGAAAALWTHRVPFDWQLETSTFSGPPPPAVDISQRELAWTSDILIGWRMEHERDCPFTNLGFSFEVPVVTSRASFECVGCTTSMTFSSFTPGWRLGVYTGLSFD